MPVDLLCFLELCVPFSLKVSIAIIIAISTMQCTIILRAFLKFLKVEHDIPKHNLRNKK